MTKKQLNSRKGGRNSCDVDQASLGGFRTLQANARVNFFKILSKI